MGKSHIWVSGVQGKLRPFPQLVLLPPPQHILQVAIYKATSAPLWSCPMTCSELGCEGFSRCLMGN